MDRRIFLRTVAASSAAMILPAAEAYETDFSENLYDQNPELSRHK